MGPRSVHLTSYSSEIVMVAPRPGYRSLVCFCQFMGFFSSLLNSSHENGCKITVECENLESGAENSTCSLSSRYPRTVRTAPQLGCQSWVCLCKLLALFGLS